MSLSAIEIIEVEEYLKSNDKKIIYVFAPSDVGQWDNHKFEPGHYLAWLRSQYPGREFDYTCTLLCQELSSRVNDYLQMKWQFRNTSLGVIRQDLVRLRGEIVPLRRIKQAVVCLREAQKEMNQLRI